MAALLPPGATPVTQGSPLIPSDFAVYGPIVIGVLLGVLGLGAQAVQTIVFLANSKSGWRTSLMLLASQWLLDLSIAQSASDCSRLLKLTVYHAGDLIYFIELQRRPEEVISPILSILICTTAQIFLARRCILFARISQSPNRQETIRYKLRVWTISIVLAVGIVLSFSGGLGAAIALWAQLEKLVRYRSKVEAPLRSISIYADRENYPDGPFPQLSTLWLSASTVTDVLLSGVIIFEMVSLRRKETGNRLVASIIRVAFPSGVIVTAMQLLTIITWYHAISSWADCATICISKIYALTVLSSITSPKEAARERRPQPPTPPTDFSMTPQSQSPAWRESLQPAGNRADSPERDRKIPFHLQRHTGRLSFQYASQSSKMMIPDDESTGDLSTNKGLHSYAGMGTFGALSLEHVRVGRNGEAEDEDDEDKEASKVDRTWDLA